jgi:hypothetical protein
MRGVPPLDLEKGRRGWNVERFFFFSLFGLSPRETFKVKIFEARENSRGSYDPMIIKTIPKGRSPRAYIYRRYYEHTENYEHGDSNLNGYACFSTCLPTGLCTVSPDDN